MPDHLRPAPTPPGAPRPYTSHELHRIGSDYLRRANHHMAHARHGGQGGGAYTPLPESAVEHAGLYVVHHGTARAGLASLDHQLRHVDPGENEALWREAREILAACVAHEGRARA